MEYSQVLQSIPPLHLNSLLEISSTRDNIFSFASADGPKKAEWIMDAMFQIYTNQSIAGFVWFNENKEQNWLVNSDTASLLAFKTLLP